MLDHRNQPDYVPATWREWAETHSKLLELVAQGLLRDGEWPAAEELAREILRKGGTSVPTVVLGEAPASIASVLTSEPGASERVVLGIFGLRLTEAGRPLLEGFAAVVRIAVERFALNRPDGVIRYEDLAMLCSDAHLDVRALSTVLHHCADFLGDGSGGEHEAAWSRAVTEKILPYRESSTADEYLRVRAREAFADELMGSSEGAGQPGPSTYFGRSQAFRVSAPRYQQVEPERVASRPIASEQTLERHAYETLREDYLRDAEDKWRGVDLRRLGRSDGEGEPHWLSFGDLHEPLLANHLPTADDASESKSTDRAGWSRQTIIELFDANRPSLALLGDPGSGKTVALQWLARELIERGRARLREGGGAFKLPIVIRAPDYVKFYRAEFAKSSRPQPNDIGGFLAEGIESHYAEDQFERMFSLALRNGEAAILVDGLDEIRTFRYDALRALSALTTYAHGLNAGNRVVMTCRTRDFDERTKAIFSELSPMRAEMQPMSHMQIQEVSRRFFAAEGRPEEREPFQERLQALITADRDGRLAQLVANPLHLVSMCRVWLHPPERSLPDTEYELYKQLILVTAFWWRKPDVAGEDSRNVDADAGLARVHELLDDSRAFLKVLSDIAVAIYDDHPDGRIPEDRLKAVLEKAMFGESHAVAPRVMGRASRALVERIRPHTGIFGPVPLAQKEEYEFHHQLYAEYLLAHSLWEALPAGTEREEKLYRQLVSRIDDPRWREPMLMVARNLIDAERVALMARAGRDDRSTALDKFVGMMVMLAVERSADRTSDAEIQAMLELVASAYVFVVGDAEVVSMLDRDMRTLREHVGPARFEAPLLGLISRRSERSRAMAGLIRRQHWLSEASIRALAATPEADSALWDWPVQRALRSIAAPLPAAGHAADHQPESEEAEVGAQTREALDEVRMPLGVLPVWSVLSTRPVTWAKVLRDADCARVVCTLFGGIEYQDALRTAKLYYELGALLCEPYPNREDAMRRKDSEFASLLTGDDRVEAAAVWLDSARGESDWVPDIALPQLDPSWATRESSAGVREMLLRWLNESPGEASALRRELELAARSGVATDRAEAELGLLMLDGRRMSDGKASLDSLVSALAMSADGVLGSHREWVRWIFDARTRATPTERAAMYRMLLRVTFRLIGRPLSLAPSPLDGGQGSTTAHPLLLADRLARQCVAHFDWWPDNEDDVEPLRIGVDSDVDTINVLGWLTTLPYWPGGPALWLNPEPEAFGACSEALVETLNALVAWTRAECSRIQPELADLVRTLTGRLRTVDGEGVDLAFRLVADSVGIAAPEGACLQVEALTILAGEREEVRAEAFYRMRSHLVEDENVQTAAAAIVDSIESPILRADASGSLGLAGSALIEATTGQMPPAAGIAMYASALMLEELDRLEPAGASGIATSDERSLAEHGFHLDRSTLAAIIAGARGDDEHAKARLLSMAWWVDRSAVGGLERLREETSSPVLAAASRDLLALRSAEAGGAAMWSVMADISSRAPAQLALRATLDLIGVRHSPGRRSRARRVGREGLERWWELGILATTDRDRHHLWLYTMASRNWVVDDPVIVREAAARAAAGDRELRAWKALVATDSIWLAEAQLALAEWLRTANTSPSFAEACVDMAAQLLTAGHEHELEGELADAIELACQRHGIETLSVSVTTDAWRAEVVQDVVEACEEACLGESAPGEAAAHADAVLARRVRPATGVGAKREDLAVYGGLFWVRRDKNDAERFVPDSLGGARVIGLLCEWALAAHAELDVDATQMARAKLESILSTLVVLADREPDTFAECAEPGRMQGVFSDAATGFSSISAQAGLELLCLLRSLDANPASGSSLIEVIEVAVRRDASVYRKAVSALARLGSVGSSGYASALVDRIRACRNETVVQALFGLAASYAASPYCQPAEREEIRKLLGESIVKHGDAVAVSLTGSGTCSSPFRMIAGATRSETLRQLDLFGGV